LNSQSHIQLKSFGPSALLIEWPAKIDEAINREVLSIHKLLLNKTELGIVECIPAYHSLLVEFDPKKIAKENLEEQLLSLIAAIDMPIGKTKQWEIPVIYNGADLAELCDQKGISQAELIEWHTAPIYRVYFLGFLPGFLYLGGLDPRLHTPRRSTPRAKVPKGAVAIGGHQTGIYPQNCPGGWQLIGQTDFEWFSKEANPPSSIQAGDTLKFLPIE